MSNIRQFPEDFILGAATAAYQIEGASHVGGRTDSIWDVFCRIPGAVAHAHDGSVACDHYSRYRDDVKIMAELGLEAYRFSASWSRVQPDGGAVNPVGMDFYSRLVDELLEHEISPWLTLYHWDLPQALEDRGGWANRDTAFLFQEYAQNVHDALGDRVNVWTTLNEPWCSAFLGYTAGVHAPGLQSPSLGLAAAHHLLLGHGLATRTLRERDANLTLGITLNLTNAEPENPTDDRDVDLARRVDGQVNRIFLDPLFRGQYPVDLLADTAHLRSVNFIVDGDLDLIATPIDMLGVNYYHGDTVSAGPAFRPLQAVRPETTRSGSPFPAAEGIVPAAGDYEQTSMGWEIQPKGLSELLVRVSRDYASPAGVPLYVTENGAAFADQPVNGKVDDGDRVEFIREHLEAVLDAVDAGVDVRGFFYWSLMDNFEWAWGYDQRFGLVRVDYETLERTIKESGRYFASAISSRSVPERIASRGPEGEVHLQ